MAALDRYLESPLYLWEHIGQYNQCGRHLCTACDAWRVAARAACDLDAKFKQEGKSAIGAYVLAMYGMREVARWPVSDGKGFEIDFNCTQYIPNRETAASKILGLNK